MPRRPLDKELFRNIQKDVALQDPSSLLAKAQLIRERMFKQQIDFLDDPYRFKTILCGRRAGKTISALGAIGDICLRRKGALVAYVSITRGQAKRNLWNPLKEWAQQLDLDLKYNHTELVATFPNGSTLYIIGADTEAEMEKLRGVAHDLVIIDECKSFRSIILDELVTDIIPPGLNDRLGTLVMMGTPGSVLKGEFYEATVPGSKRGRPWKDKDNPYWQGKPFEWSTHRWHIVDNVAMPHLWPASLADKARKGWKDDNPTWLREYLGQWLANDGRLVYRYVEERNGYSPLEGTPFGLPADHEWKFLLGVDLGYDDDFALQVAAYSDTCEEFYQVYEFASPQLILPEIAAQVRKAEAIFGDFEVMVGDRGGLGKTIFETLKAEPYNIHIEMADKHEKRDHIEILNSELADGKCKIMRHSKLAEEMQFLKWSDSRRDEEGSNHCCDAFLYLWRWSLHHLSKAREKLPAHGSVEHGQRWDEAQVRLAEEEYLKKNRQDYWENVRGSIKLDEDEEPSESWDGFDA